MLGKNIAKVFFLLIIAIGFFWAQSSYAAGWVAQSSGVNVNLRDIDMVDQNTGFAVGDGGTILKTTNGGKNWSTVYTSVGDSFYGIDMYSTSIGWVVGMSGKILYTANGGTSWTAQTSGIPNLLQDVSAKNGVEVVAVGAGGIVLRTINGGATWTMLQADLAAVLYGVEFSSCGTSRCIWTVGTNGTIVYTSYANAGDTPNWTAQTSGTTATLYDIKKFPGTFNLRIAGSGVVLYTSSSGSNWSAIQDGEMTQNFSGLDIFSGGIYTVDSSGIIYRGTQAAGNWTWATENSGTSQGLNSVAVQSSPVLTAWAVGGSGAIVRYDETAPTAPSNLTKTTADTDNTPTFSWTASSDDVNGTIGSGGITYQYALNGSATYAIAGSNTSVTVIIPSLSNGSHTISVRAVDAAYNYSELATLSFTINAPDTTSPGVGGVTPTSATVGVAQTYSANYSDNIGVSSCQLVYDDLGFVPMTVTGGTNGTATKSYFFSSVGSHTLQAKCYDAAGNTGLGPVIPITVSAVPDTTPPTVSAISPATATANSSQSFTASYYDNIGVTSCELYVNDISQGNMSLVGTTSGTATKSLTLFVIDSYVLKAKCSDGTNTTWGAATTVTVGAAAGPDTTSPTGSIMINSGAAYTNNSSVTLTLSCSDNVACARMIVAIDGTVDTESLEGYVASKTVTLSGGDGTKTVAVKFKDGANNTSAQYTDTIILDTTAQDTSIIEKPASPSTVGLGYFSFGFSGSSITPVTYECRLDTSVFSACSIPKIYEGLSAGSHTFYVRAIDAAGNVDATPDSYTWTITSATPADTTSPIVGAITPITAQATVSQSFTASYSDAVGVASCNLYVDSSNQGAMTLSGTKTGTASREYTFANTASHTLQARCSDEAGNTGLGGLTTVSVSAAPVNVVDTAAPTAPSNLKKTNDETDKTPTFTWDGSSDNTGVTSYWVQVDDSALINNGGSLTYTPSELSVGSHTIKIYAKDAAGNIGATASFIFSVKASSTTPTPISCSLTINGAYKLSSSPAVYYITDECAKRPFNKANVFFTYFNSWSDVVATTKIKLDKIPLDTLGFMPWGPKYDPKYGALVKIVSDPKVYLLLGGEKYWITAEEIFNGLKYSWNWVEDIDKKLLDKYITGSEINYTDHHPNYTLIKYAASTKIYRLEPDPTDSGKQVKRHIKNEKVFNALNFRWDRIVTISKSEAYKDGEELSEKDI
ncbi:MAG: hypothetical protein HY569_01370 [Candidatus Magasanikbacteria bacterium]|nr:hypothetical protein [Candidatus Magasanikbacteria bacterium]